MKINLPQFIHVKCSLLVLFGRRATEPYPFMAWMGACGASLVDPQWILTAAHCATKFVENPSPIYFGSHKREEGWSTEYSEVIRHPKFHHNKKLDRVLHDIALIKLKDRVPSNVATPINIPASKSLTNYDKFEAKMTGWGYNQIPFLAPSEILHEANLKMTSKLPFQFCKIPGKLCSVVINENGPRMAPGDSGGPLFFKVGGDFVQIGIITVLWLHPQRIYINEFTDVAFYSNWLKKVINGHEKFSNIK